MSVCLELIDLSSSRSESEHFRCIFLCNILKFASKFAVFMLMILVVGKINEIIESRGFVHVTQTNAPNPRIT